MHDFAREAIEHQIGRMPIAQAQDVTHLKVERKGSYNLKAKQLRGHIMLIQILLKSSEEKRAKKR